MVAKRLLEVLSPEERDVTSSLLGYDEGTAGREMTPSFVDLRSDMTVEQALARIRQLAIDRETVYECYVMDGQRHLVGMVSLKDLVLAQPDREVGGIMNPNPPMVFTHTPRQEVVVVLRDNELIAVPVVDSEKRLVGIITYDDVADIMEEELTEDVYRFAAVPGTEHGYFTSRIFGVVGRRIIWLLLLLMVNLITGSIIAGQEELIGEVVILAAFIPLLLATAGNMGAQSATVVIRGLATGEISHRRAVAITLRDAGVGLLLGVILGLIVLLSAYGLGRNIEVAAVVSITLLSISALSTLSGSALPFLFRSINVDPAFVSAPLITTVMDISGIVIYFFVARLLITVG
jgi:magnesium transporter